MGSTVGVSPRAALRRNTDVTSTSRAIAVAAACAGLVISGCGSSNGASDGSPSSTAPRAIFARVNATCRDLRREVAKLGKGALNGNSSIVELITERLVKPSIPLLERVALRQQKLAAQSRDPKLILYARLFEPIIVLAQERLRTGRVSEHPGKAQATILARGFENLMTSVAAEQRQVAREARLPACAINFEHVLTSSLSG
jgi:hypothetical protein